MELKCKKDGLSKRSKIIFLFLESFFFRTHGKLAASFEALFFSVNGNKGFVLTILLPELNERVR